MEKRTEAVFVYEEPKTEELPSILEEVLTEERIEKLAQYGELSPELLTEMADAQFEELVSRYGKVAMTICMLLDAMDLIEPLPHHKKFKCDCGKTGPYVCKPIAILEE